MINKKEELSNMLKTALCIWKIEYDTRIFEDFSIYKDILLEYNSHTNLTAIKDEKDIYIKHFIDSISTFEALKYLNEKYNFDVKNAKYIDIGAGAGFPSFPIKIVDRQLDITMLDSLKKRTKFLSLLSEQLGMEKLEILHERAEDSARNGNRREKYDVVLSRAVANLPVLLEYSLPFVKVGGFMVCLKGPLAEEEIENSKKALRLLGGKVVEVLSIDIPFSDLNHKIVIIKKIAKTNAKYPRKAGTPSKEPLI